MKIPNTIIENSRFIDMTIFYEDEFREDNGRFIIPDQNMFKVFMKSTDLDIKNNNKEFINFVNLSINELENDDIRHKNLNDILEIANSIPVYNLDYISKNNNIDIDDILKFSQFEIFEVTIFGDLEEKYIIDDNHIEGVVLIEIEKMKNGYDRKTVILRYIGINKDTSLHLITKYPDITLPETSYDEFMKNMEIVKITAPLLNVREDLSEEIDRISSRISYFKDLNLYKKDNIDRILNLNNENIKKFYFPMIYR